MKGGTQAALALGVGYLLGRRRKMRWATLLAAGAATGGLAGLGSGLLRKGVQALGSTEALGQVAPQLGNLADTVRGDLIEAGKAAATAAVTNRVESLTDSLHERADLIRDPGAAAAGAGAATAGAAAGGATRAARTGAGEATRRVRRARPSARDEEADEVKDEDDLRDDDEPRADDKHGADEEYDPREPDEPVAGERGATRQRPAPRRRRSAATTQRRSPVARSGR